MTKDDLDLLTLDADELLFNAVTVEERAAALDACRFADRCRTEFCRQLIIESAQVLRGHIIWGKEKKDRRR